MQYNSGPDGKWDYVGGIVYHNNTIGFIGTEEGRAIRTGNGSYGYQYSLKDHLGNVRASFDRGGNGQAHLLQEDEYFSFGLRKPLFDASNNNRYLYNGKEVQTDLTGQYDYGARFYDPVVAKFTTIDPMAEDFEQLSPYNYAMNNPMLMIDPDGMAADSSNKPVPKPQPSAIGPLVVSGSLVLQEVTVVGNVVSKAVPVLAAAWTGWTIGDRMAKNIGPISAGIGAFLTKLGVDPNVLYAPSMRPAIVQSKGKDKLKGGKQNARDKGLTGYPKSFKDWLHHRSQDEGKLEDYTIPEIKELWQEWNDAGKPNNKK